MGGRERSCFKSSKDGEPFRAVNVRGAAAGRPKSARKGHPHALRLDVVETEAQAAGKFVFSMGSAAELAVWLERLGQFTDNAEPPPSPVPASAAAAAAARSLSATSGGVVGASSTGSWPEAPEVPTASEGAPVGTAHFPTAPELRLRQGAAR